MSKKRAVAALAMCTGALLTATPGTADAHLRAPRRAEASTSRTVRARAGSDAVVVALTPSTTATTAPPPPPPPPPFVCPVQGAVEFIDSWGFPRSGGRRHQGVDMMAAEGTPVVASVSGTVEHRGNRTGGLSYHLVGDDGVYYYGTHLSAYETAGYVAQGTVIGYVGGTGNARGNPHLHFEIHPGGQGSPAVNPYPTVAEFC
ncbi:MAG: M23 family metallopeptidase [Acidimicrobiales bacterium]